MTTKICETDNRIEIEKQSRAALPAEIVDYIKECNGLPHPKSHLISVLHKVQGIYGYLPKEQLDAVAQLMQIPTSKVTGVATFYHYFRLDPRGKFVIQVCLGTACYVRGAERIIDRLRDELGIGFGETTKDGLFTLEPARCLGTCAMAPVVMVGEKIHGNITPDQIPAFIERYVRAARAGAEEPSDN
jgi:NADH-quinone oxidoreductase E subunit